MPEPASDLTCSGHPSVSSRYGAAMSKASLVIAIARRAGPRLIEAMVIPAVLFYLALEIIDVRGAYAVAMGWSFSAIAVRRVIGRPVTALHVIVGAGLVLRTALAVGTDSTFVYFVQPVLASVALSGIFLLSIRFGKPMIGRLAHEFCPLDTDAAGRPGVATLFRNLTYLWATVILAKGAITLVLLVTVPLPVFVLTRTLGLWVLTGAAIAVTFAMSFRAALSEQLVPVTLTNGDTRFVVTASRNAAT